MTLPLGLSLRLGCSWVGRQEQFAQRRQSGQTRKTSQGSAGSGRLSLDLRQPHLRNRTTSCPEGGSELLSVDSMDCKVPARKNFMNPGLSVSWFGRAAGGLANALRRRGRRVSALAEGLVEHHRPGGRNVERTDAAGHGNAQQVVAGAPDQIVQPRALAAQHQNAVAGQVELVVVRPRRARPDQ